MDHHSVIGVIFSKDKSQVLLTKRRDVPVWVLPGGGIEKNETPEKAIIREILEETGYLVQISRKVGEYTPINKLAKHTHLYETNIIKGEVKDNDEVNEIRFFSLHSLPKLLPPPFLEWIFEAKENKPVIYRELSSVNYFTLFKNIFSHPILILRFLLSKIGLTINT